MKHFSATACWLCDSTYQLLLPHGDIAMLNSGRPSCGVHPFGCALTRRVNSNADCTTSQGLLAASHDGALCHTLDQEGHRGLASKTCVRCRSGKALVIVKAVLLESC